MKILVAIANYGTKNIRFAKELIREYLSMPFNVEIYVLSEAPKSYGDDVKVIVGLPSKNPWSLPFVHKKLFAENADNFDLFIYTEDDTLIRTQHILSFLKATKTMRSDLIPGFIRYEMNADGK